KAHTMMNAIQANPAAPRGTPSRRLNGALPEAGQSTKPKMLATSVRRKSPEPTKNRPKAIRAVMSTATLIRRPGPDRSGTFTPQAGRQGGAGGGRPLSRPTSKGGLMRGGRGGRADDGRCGGQGVTTLLRGGA